MGRIKESFCTVVSMGLALVSATSVSAQGNPPDTERLNAQMQSAAVGAAARPAPPASSAVPNANCTLIIPPDPLSAKGLATPYRLKATDPGLGPCSESNTAQSAFVQAAIFDPATNSISVYNPLV